MSQAVIDDLNQTQLQTLEQHLRRALLEGDVATVDALLSPALFALDAQGARLRCLPWLQAWREGRWRLQQLDLQPAETLPCAALALRCGDIQIGGTLDGALQPLQRLRLLRVWARSRSGSGARLLSISTFSISTFSMSALPISALPVSR